MYLRPEAVSERIYQRTYEAVLTALEPFTISDRLLDDVACEAAENAVEAESEPEEF